jgi:uncharacterized membrane protein YqgA involved in biofilm formation
MAIGINFIVRMNTLAVVVLAVVLGTVVGEMLKLQYLTERGLSLLTAKMTGTQEPSGEFKSRFTSLLVLCCASGTGIFGALNEGLTGDASTLLAKAVLDFPTVIIFAYSLGLLTCTIALPQGVVFFVLFLFAKKIMPWITPEMRMDFSAVGGVISLATGFKIACIKDVAIINMLPALLFIFPISWLWEMIPL